MGLTSLLPCVRWQARPGLEVWGLPGAGSGEMELGTEGFMTDTSDLTSFLGAVGGRQELATRQGIDLALKADAFASAVRSRGQAAPDALTFRLGRRW